VGTGEEFFAFLRDSFDVLYEEGRTHPRMMSVGMHNRILGHPGRAAGLQRFLDYVTQKPEVWVTRRLDIARHWIATHLPE
jgi:peptidoglycan/xylan/chitin deacetylase (PgdA/CDA1 family)